MSESRITIPCGEITLEGVLHLPTGAGPFPAVVVCHPHPLYGGDMRNEVVLAVCRASAGAGVAALRFNFRGVGRSGGDYGGGVDEQEDIAAAISYVCSLPDIDSGKVGLVGYSFGASTAAKAVVNDGRVASQIKLLALISAPLGELEWAGLKEVGVPKLFIAGSNDNFVRTQELLKQSAEVADPKQTIIVPDADHFWFDHETELAARVTPFILESFKTAGG